MDEAIEHRQDLHALAKDLLVDAVIGVVGQVEMHSPSGAVAYSMNFTRHATAADVRAAGAGTKG